MDHFYVNGRLYVLVCDYFSKFPFVFQTRTATFANLRGHLQELFVIEDTPDEIMSDNGPPFNGKEFNTFLTGLGIRHTTSSSNYPQSNGFIERQIQMVKRLMEKDTSTGRSFQEALTDLRAKPLGDDLPSPAEILYGRSLVTRKATSVDVVAVHQSLIALQVKYTKNYDKSRHVKTQQVLVIGEEVNFLSAKDEWQIGTVAGTRDTGRSYDIFTGEGTSLRSFDILIISQYCNCRTSTPSQSEITRNVISGQQHPPNVKYFYNNDNNFLSGPA